MLCIIYEVSSVIWGRLTRVASLLSVTLHFTEIFGYFDCSCSTIIMCLTSGGEIVKSIDVKAHECFCAIRVERV